MAEIRCIHTYAPAKLNLRLRVVGRRADGFHLLESLMVPISLLDALEFRIGPGRRNDIAVRCWPDTMPQQRENLAFKAARRFLRQTGIAAEIAISIRKQIPAGAGLGGGSSDAATVLMVLNRTLGTPLTMPELITLGAGLGADIPFFLAGAPAEISGIGELVRPHLGELPSWVVVASDRFVLSTAKVFQEFDRSLTSPYDQSINPPAQRPALTAIVNDLESAACRIHPEIGSLKQRLLELGAHQSGMTGSGSAVFGFFNGALSAQYAAHSLRQSGLWARPARVLSTSPIAVG